MQIDPATVNLIIVDPLDPAAGVSVNLSHHDRLKFISILFPISGVFMSG